MFDDDVRDKPRCDRCGEPKLCEQFDQVTREWRIRKAEVVELPA